MLDPETGEHLDDGLVLWFPAPRSATGEDVAEFHVHGSRAVLGAVMRVLGRLGMRLAEPGEFTRRAFLNGKLDLLQAEAIADLAAAETEAQRRQALRQLDGELGGLYYGWRDRLTRILAHLEAAIDFPDEDLPKGLADEVKGGITQLQGEIAAHLDDRRGERLRQGIGIAIIGPTNAGKSSLLNLLARRDAAIVSETAGTTRDIIEVQLDLDGYPVTVIDTAGIRETADPVEQEGVRRARARAAEADLILWLTDAEGPGLLPQSDAPVWRVRNKIDLVATAETLRGGKTGEKTFVISARHGDGIAELLSALVGFAQDFFGATEGGLIARARQRDLLQQAAASLQRSIAAIGKGEELAAEDLRSAAYALGRLLGRVDVEDILDVIFREFCIGK